MGTTRHNQVVHLQGPAGTGIGGVLLCLAYPSSKVRLVGSNANGTGAVTGRVTSFSGSSSVNDFNGAVQLALTPNGSPEQVNFTLSFDLCNGQTPPTASAFNCVVKQASDEFSNPIEPPSLVECTPQ
jgi:hypothetical protein